MSRAEERLALVELEVGDALVATGVPVRFRYMRNTERASFFGSRFGQDIEPHGAYFLSDESGASEHPLPGWEYGWARFENPLVLSFTTSPDDRPYGPDGWKARLVDVFDRKGRALTKALTKVGYDGIMTVWGQPGFGPSYLKELVDLTFGRALTPD